MTKAEDMARTSAKGSLHLLWGLVASTGIQSVGTIFIARLLGSDAYGLYSIAIVAPMLVASFRDWGVNSAMVRCGAQCRSEGRESEIRTIYTAGLIFEIVLGLILSLISFFVSGYVATVVFNRPAVAPLMEIASITILAGGLVSAATAAFTGIERMELNSIMIVCQSIVKTFIIITLVILGFGTTGATLGYTISFIAAGFAGLLLLIPVYKNLPKAKTTLSTLKANIKSMFNYGMPLSLGAIIGTFQTQFYAILLPIYYTTNNSIIGNYGIASNFAVLISFVATPITTMLFPAFSKLSPQNDKETLKNVFKASIRYASILVVPTAALVMCLSQPAVSTIFGSTYDTAPLFLALLAIGYMFTAFGSLSTSNLINSQGETKYNLKLAIITAIIGFPMGLILILNFGVLGLIIAALISSLPSLFLSLQWAKKKYELTVDWTFTAKILGTSLLTALITYVIILEVKTPNWASLLLGAVIFFASFIIIALLTRTIKRSDIVNIRGMTTGFGVIRKVLNIFLNFIEKLIDLLNLENKNHVQ
jgi:O-antigen/teichoic acid export membrane protein